MKRTNSHLKRKCTVVKNCPNNALPGRRTCGRHGKSKRASRSSGRARFVHLDCSVPALVEALEPINAAEPDITIEVRDGGTILGLPTNKPQMMSFLRDWLGKHQGNLSLLEALTPPAIVPAPLLANAYCAIAERLVRFDLGGGAA